MPDGPVNVLAEDSPDPEVALPPPSPPAASGRGRKKGPKAKEEVELIVTPIDPVHIVMYTYAQVGRDIRFAGMFWGRRVSCGHGLGSRCPLIPSMLCIRW